ncbi:M20 metallopeptidase family protein [Marinilabilia rubra]|uniref:Amidohydrolase n=1 Tax=Marinilabilia rubra TaxID=2162893 RepID=A0A2U2B689_9BACT|nr:M20 family metallopeptidase [Marinilabilia rubra]PWD98553.1 amidohydrolase [Marinilabilia rubra]
MEDLKQSIKTLTKENLEKIIAHRRHIHQNPELSFEENETSAYVSAQLTEMGIPHKKGIAGTGILATISGKGEGRTVALRADMDALPIQEDTGLSFSSQNKGVMHACGHDAHTAALLGVGQVLNQIKEQWNGTVLLLFQPGEEKFPGGASLLLEEGALDDPKPDLVIGQHVLPDMPAGQVGFKPGMYMASGDEVYLTVKGKGGHAALPHTLNDNILIASNIIVSLQQIVARMVPANIPTVLSFGRIEGLGATNIIPEKVEIAGTLRTMNEEWRSKIKDKIREMASGIAKSMGAECVVDIKDGYPVVHNHEQYTKDALGLAKDYLDKDSVEEMDIRMTAEDFGYYTHRFPSVFYRFGVAQSGKSTGALHTPGLNINEEGLEVATGMLSWLAVNFLNKK